MSFCSHCGAQVEESHRFCARCGQSLVASAAPAPPARLARDYGRHVRLLAVVLMIWGGLGLLAMLGVLFSLGPLSTILARVTESSLASSFLHSVLVSLAWVLVAFSAAALAAGMGLLDYRPWGRWLALGVCVLALFRFPLGTAVGIYGLWVLLSAGGEQHYQQEAARRGW